MLTWWIIGIVVCSVGVFVDRHNLANYDDESLFLYSCLFMGLSIFWPILVMWYIMNWLRDIMRGDKK